MMVVVESRSAGVTSSSKGIGLALDPCSFWFPRRHARVAWACDRRIPPLPRAYPKRGKQPVAFTCVIGKFSFSFDIN
jgi:hypothetical protein